MPAALATAGVALFTAFAISIAAGQGPAQPVGSAPPADTLLAAALERARAENKTVFVDFGASWCGPCRALDAFFAAPDNARLMNEHFIVLKLTEWERGPLAVKNNLGAEKLANGWGGGDGIPFYVTVDATGRKIGSGGGYPSNRQSITAFLDLLAKSAPRLLAATRTTLASYLTEHSDGQGTIEGRVLDGRGQPVARASVTIMGRAFVDGQWKLARFGRATSDDGGHYAADIAAGDHVVAAEPTSALRAAPAGQSLAPITFHPSAITRAGARTILLDAGAGRTGIDIIAAPARTAVVTGTVMTSDGRPEPSAPVTLTNVDWPSLTFNTTTDASGRFTLPAVPWGRFTLWTRNAAPTAPGAAPLPVESGSANVDVSSAAPAPLRIITRPAARLSGRVVFDGPALSEADRQAIRVTAVASRQLVGAPTAIPQSSVAEDGTFEMTVLFGERVIRMQELPPGWMLTSVMRGGVDITDQPWDPTAGGGAALEVTVTNRAGSITGRRASEGHLPAKGGVGIAFAKDATKWTYPSRFIRRAPVQDDGTFEIGPLPAGEYLLALLPVLPRNWDAPESLEALRARATGVILAAGEHARVSLRVLSAELRPAPPPGTR